MENKKGKCLNCGHEQEIIEGKNVWEDNLGKYTACGKCDSTYDVEQ